MPFCTKTECSLPGSGSQRSVAIMTFQHISSGLASVGVPRNTLKVDSSVQSLSCVQLFATPSELAPTHVHRVSGTIQPSHPLSSSALPAFNLSHLRVFSNESVLSIRWPKNWDFSFCTSPSNEYSGLISFRMDRLYLLAVQGTLKSLFQRHSSKASFFSAQLSL